MNRLNPRSSKNVLNPVQSDRSLDYDTAHVHVHYKQRWLLTCRQSHSETKGLRQGTFDLRSLPLICRNKTLRQVPYKNVVVYFYFE